MPGRNRFIFKPPYFPKYDSIAPSLIFTGNSRKLGYVRCVLRITVSVMLITSCVIFSLCIYARMVFGESVPRCSGLLGEESNSNDRSVTLVIPQITIGVFILTFVVLFNGYNLLIQFLIVLTILESLTLLVWRYQLPSDTMQLNYDTYFRRISQQMRLCTVVNNVTGMDSCWQMFMASYCPEWPLAESAMCPDSKKTYNYTIDIGGNKGGENIDSGNIITDCFHRFKRHPWTNISREDVYMRQVSPQTTVLLVVHASAVTFMYIVARIYVKEYSRLRTKWIEELMNYHSQLIANNSYQGV